MKTPKPAGALAFFAFGLALSGAVNASTYSYSGLVTLCTATCDSFAALSVGSTLSFTFAINTTPSGTFGDADMGPFSSLVFNSALPVSGPVGDPVNDNPLVIYSTLGIVASNGTAITTDAFNRINGGQMLLEFLVPPFSSNGAFMVFDFANSLGSVCLFYATSGCIPGATEALRFDFSIPVPAAIWLFGSALLGMTGLARRNVIGTGHLA